MVVPDLQKIVECDLWIPRFDFLQWVLEICGNTHTGEWPLRLSTTEAKEVEFDYFPIPSYQSRYCGSRSSKNSGIRTVNPEI